ncbi:hypothetical protein D6764_00580 [Candidatus Woesearchaeota archaeon]|nr:MAG: hypothetical protein D6764_00580 [Candidatus Woesearchaeota archaeon]
MGFKEWFKDSFLNNHSAFWNTVSFTIEKADGLKKKVGNLYSIEEELPKTPLKELNVEEKNLERVSLQVEKKVTELQNLTVACVNDFNALSKKNYDALTKLKNHAVNGVMGVIRANLNRLRPAVNGLLTTSSHKDFLNFLDKIKDYLKNVLENLEELERILKDLMNNEEEMRKHFVTKEEIETLFHDFC